MNIGAIVKESEDVTRVTFSRDGHEVTKSLWFGGAVRATTRPGDRKQVAARTFVRAMREADRDIAYKLYGADFRKHCEFQSNFWRELTPEEMAKIL